MAVLPDRVAGKLPKYTSLGCYPLFYVTEAGDVLCADCATAALDSEETQDPPVAYDTNWENSVLGCEDCGEGIECAYVDPEEE